MEHCGYYKHPKEEILYEVAARVNVVLMSTHLVTVCIWTKMTQIQGYLTFYLKLLEPAGRVTIKQKAGGVTGSRASGLNRNGQQEIV